MVERVFDGATAPDNPACLCTHHHRLSHQAPGWALRRTTDRAGLQWTTPTGQTLITRPPAAGHDDDLVTEVATASGRGSPAPAGTEDGAPPC